MWITINIISQFYNIKCEMIMKFLKTNLYFTQTEHICLIYITWLMCAKCRFIAFTVTQQNFTAPLVRISGTSRLLHFLFFLLELLVVPTHTNTRCVKPLNAQLFSQSTAGAEGTTIGCWEYICRSTFNEEQNAPLCCLSLFKCYSKLSITSNLPSTGLTSSICGYTV